MVLQGCRAEESIRRLPHNEMSQRREDDKSEEYKEENSGNLGGSASDVSESTNGGNDCHDEED